MFHEIEKITVKPVDLERVGRREYSQNRKDFGRSSRSQQRGEEKTFQETGEILIKLIHFGRVEKRG